MLPTDVPLIHLKKFKAVLLNPSSISVEDYKILYYKALLVAPEVRYMKSVSLKGDAKAIETGMNKIIENTSTKSQEGLERDLNVTLYNILKFHLDSFIGKENTEATLETIQKELTRLIDPIFDGTPPFRIDVEDTTKDRDESKSVGSTFRVRIVPILFNYSFSYSAV